MRDEQAMMDKHSARIGRREFLLSLARGAALATLGGLAFAATTGPRAARGLCRAQGACRRCPAQRRCRLTE